MKLLRHWIHRPLYSQEGFSLLETLVAVAILSFVGASVVTAVGTNARAVGILDEQVTAMNIATGFFESIRQLNYDDDENNEYAAAGDNVTVPLQYIVDVDVTYSDDGNIWVASDNRSTEKLQRITITVSRTGGKSVLSICTYRTDR